MYYKHVTFIIYCQCSILLIVCRNLKGWRTLFKISEYHFHVKILQGVFNLYAGRGEEAVNSQVLVYFYSLYSVLQDASCLGKKAAHCDKTGSGCCTSLSQGASSFLKAPNSMTTVTIIFQKASVCPFYSRCVC